MFPPRMIPGRSGQNAAFALCVPPVYPSRAISRYQRPSQFRSGSTIQWASPERGGGISPYGGGGGSFGMPKRRAEVAGIWTSNQWMTQTRSGNAHHSALSPRRGLPFFPLARRGAPSVMDVRVDGGAY